MSIGHTIIGSGQEKVLVLHGWFGDYAVWEPTFPSLDKETFTYVFMDYRGYGKSIELKGEYTMREIAGDAIGLMNDLDIERFHVVGNETDRHHQDVPASLAAELQDHLQIEAGTLLQTLDLH